MTTSTLRPATPALTTGSVTQGSAPANTINAVLADDNDDSYVTFNPGEDGEVSLDDLTLPAGALIASVSVRLRSRRINGTGTPPVLTEFVPNGLSGGDSSRISISWSSPTTHTVLGPLTTVPFSGDPYADADIDGATLRLDHDSPTSSTDIRLYAAYVDVVYVPIPVVSISAPSGDVFNENSPDVVFETTLDLDGNQQTHAEVKVFTEAQYSAGGFDPATSDSYFEEEFEAETLPFLSSPTTTYTGLPTLPNGNLRVYVRAAQTVNGELHWSVYDSSDFTLATIEPAVPTITASGEDAGGRNLVEVATRERTNLIINPRAAVNTTGWTNTGMATFERDTTNPVSGAGLPSGITESFRCVGNGANDAVGLSTGLSGWVAGDEGHASVYIYLTSLSATHVRVMVAQGFNPLATEEFTTVGGSEWTRIDLPFTCVDSNTLQMTFTQIGAGACEFNFTAALLEREYVPDGTLGAYFDGSFDDCSWSGTAHASTSEGPDTTVFYVERSYDNGATWVPLPPGDSGVEGFWAPDAGEASIYDYQAPNGGVALYRVSAVHFYTLALTANSASTDPVSATWASNETWLKHPTDSSLNMTVRLRSLPSESRELVATKHRVLGRRLPVVVSDTPLAPEGDVVFFGMDNASREALDALIDSQQPLLMQLPTMDVPFPDRWVRFTDSHTRERWHDNANAPDSWEQLHWVEVDQPEGSLAEGGDLVLG